MKNTIIVILLVGLIHSNTTSAQVISKDKNTAIENIKAAGYEVKTFPSENKFSYVRFDNFGKSLVNYEFTGNIIRRVTFQCEKAATPLDMERDVLAHIPLDGLKKSQESHGIWGSGDSRLFAPSSVYYKSDAIYSYDINQPEKVYTFIITIL